MAIPLAGSRRPLLDDIDVEICRDIYETCKVLAAEGVRPLDAFPEQSLYTYQDMFIYMAQLSYAWLGYELTVDMQIKIIITYRENISTLETRARSRYNKRQRMGVIRDEYILS